jgi:hypothetical protein
VQAIAGVVSRLSSSNFKFIGTHQHQPISTRIHLGILGNIPTRHPRTHDAKRKQRLRNLDDREQIGMGDELEPVDSIMEYLV